MAARLDGEGNGHKGPKSVCPQDGRAIVKVKPWLILLFLKHYRREIIVYMYINFRRKKKKK